MWCGVVCAAYLAVAQDSLAKRQAVVEPPLAQVDEVAGTDGRVEAVHHHTTVADHGVGPRGLAAPVLRHLLDDEVHL